MTGNHSAVLLGSADEARSLETLGDAFLRHVNGSVFSESYLLNVTTLSSGVSNKSVTSHPANHAINIWEAGKIRIPLYRLVNFFSMFVNVIDLLRQAY